MPTDAQGRPGGSNSVDRGEVSSARLWFGCIASLIAWTSAGCLDVMIVWACRHAEVFGIPHPHPFARVLFVLLAAVLLAVSIYAGIISYKNWQILAAPQQFFDAEAVERREFMAVLGMIITMTMGMGIVWLGLPTFFLDLCWRAR